MAESQHTEYKSSWRDEYLKWICGFANADGGRMFIGMDDGGNVIGLSEAKKLLEDIPNKVRDILGIIVDVNLHGTEHGDYLEIVIDAHPNPVDYKGQYHYRSGSTKQELKGAALDRFLLQRKGKRWDGVPVPNVAVGDLKPETFDFFRKKGVRSQRLDEDSLNDGNEHLLANLDLMDKRYLKRAASCCSIRVRRNFSPGPISRSAISKPMQISSFRMRFMVTCSSRSRKPWI